MIQQKSKVVVCIVFLLAILLAVSSNADQRAIPNRLPENINISRPEISFSQGCDTLDYTSGILYYYFTIPDQYGDNFFNTRFTVENYGCTLTTSRILVFNVENNA